MRYEGNLEVLRNLFRKKYLLERGDGASCEIRPALLVTTGVMRGAYGGGHGVALDTFGLAHVFDVAIGVSTGFPVLAYLLANQIRRHGDIYWQEAASKQFISFSRFVSGRGALADTNYLCSVFRGSTAREGINERAIQVSRTRLFAGVTCAKSGEGLFLDAKKVKPDLVEAIHATCAMPGFSAGPVTIDGLSYIDGATALTFPARKVIEEFAPTDLLIFANRTQFTTKGAVFDQLLSAALLMNFPHAVQKTHMQRQAQALKELAYLRFQKSCRYLILWPEGALGRFTRDSNALECAARGEQKQFESLLADVQSETSTT